MICSTYLCILLLHSSTFLSDIIRGDTKKSQNYLLEGKPLEYSPAPLHKCSRNPPLSVYQLVVLWEAAFDSREFFFKILSTHLPISRWVIYEHTCLHWLSVSSFDQKWHDPYAPPVTWSLPEWLFFVSLMKNLLKGKCFADVEEVKQKKRQTHWKASELMSSKAVLSSRKNVLTGVLHQMESTLKVTAFYTCRNKYTHFYK